ncbi:hypothetical protein GCM10011608_37320 [Micromonospora sonchi]|uniref:Uncharacterized protein n=1 Tax=Micromonospora sonchi TaxID=1763543 RepID=A0A917U0L2_9ACTN|nr:hypothetical protein GCM10011608_37320 [Micromonospora sonchi]
MRFHPVPHPGAAALRVDQASLAQHLEVGEMVGPDRSNAGVRSQTQISATDAIIDISRSRTGSPRALNIGATTAA